ncbi:MAG: hypothetical protein HQK50_04375 [Oligoflexia bacterium]|nr:hypothetical protein [Oligoflexia bacterium]MBF0364781.1 hypothetical protein [Oligoflexia bacterium]
MKKQRASIDIGSNSTLLLISNQDDITNPLAQKNFSSITMLGKGVRECKQFSQESMEKTYQCIKTYCEIIQEHSIPKEQVVITATEAARVAKNAEAFFQIIFKDFGLKVSILSPEGEAYYSALGVSLGFDDQKNRNTVVPSELLLIDLGGGSTELTHIKTSPLTIISSSSFPIGAVTATDLQESLQLTDYLSTLFKNNESLFTKFHNNTPPIVAIAGTFTSLANIILGHSNSFSCNIHGATISVEHIDTTVKQLSQDNAQMLKMKYPFLKDRANSIAAGGVVATQLLKQLQVTSLSISTFGLRHGILYAGKIQEKFFWPSSQGQ